MVIVVFRQGKARSELKSIAVFPDFGRLTRDSDGFLKPFSASANFGASTMSILASRSIVRQISFRSPRGGKTSPVYFGDQIRFADLQFGSIALEPCSQNICRQFNPLGFPERALPDCRYAPSLGEKRSVDSAVSRDIRFELRLPELRTRRRIRRVAATLVAMPEAAMHEHGGFPAREDDIRAPRKSSAAQDIAMPQSVQALPQGKFRFGGTAGYGPHDP